MIAKIEVRRTERRLSGVNEDTYWFDIMKDGDKYVAVRDDGKRFKVTTDMVSAALESDRRVYVKIFDQQEWQAVKKSAIPGSIFCRYE